MRNWAVAIINGMLCVDMWMVVAPAIYLTSRNLEYYHNL